MNQNSNIFIQEKNAFENVICQMAAILCQPQWVNGDRILLHWTLNMVYLAVPYLMSQMLKALFFSLEKDSKINVTIQGSTIPY